MYKSHRMSLKAVLDHHPVRQNIALCLVGWRVAKLALPRVGLGILRCWRSGLAVWQRRRDSARVLFLLTVALLPHLSKVEQSDDRHGEADDEQTLEEAVVAQCRWPIANSIVEYVVIEALFVIAPVVLQEVGEPLA